MAYFAISFDLLYSLIGNYLSQLKHQESKTIRVEIFDQMPYCHAETILQWVTNNSVSIIPNDNLY